jgi:hypothetical protein
MACPTVTIPKYTPDDFVSVFRKYERASTVMVVMTQPLSIDTTPLRIFSIGSNNQFNSEDVENRLKSIVKALKDEGVEVLTYAADGGSRELKIMRRNSNLGKGSLKRKSNRVYFTKFFLGNLNYNTY